MPDEIPTGEKAVYLVFEMIALGFFLGAVDAFMRGDAWWKWAGALIAGVAFMVAGVKWPKLKATIGPRVSSMVERIAGKRRYSWSIYALIAIIILATFGSRAYRHFYPANKAVVALQPVPSSSQGQTGQQQQGVGTSTQTKREEKPEGERSASGKLGAKRNHPGGAAPLKQPSLQIPNSRAATTQQLPIPPQSPVYIPPSQPAPTIDFASVFMSMPLSSDNPIAKAIPGGSKLTHYPRTVISNFVPRGVFAKSLPLTLWYERQLHTVGLRGLIRGYRVHAPDDLATENG